MKVVFDESFDIRQVPLPYHYPFDENTWNTPSPNDPADRSGLVHPILVRIVQKVCLSLGVSDMREPQVVSESTCRYVQTVYSDWELSSGPRILSRCDTTHPGEVSMSLSKSIGSRVVSLTFVYCQQLKITSGECSRNVRCCCLFIATPN